MLSISLSLKTRAHFQFAPSRSGSGFPSRPRGSSPTLVTASTVSEKQNTSVWKRKSSLILCLGIRRQVTDANSRDRESPLQRLGLPLLLEKLDHEPNR